MVGIMNVGDSATPEMYVEFSEDLSQAQLQNKIDKLKREGSRHSFNVAGYRQAGYEVRGVFSPSRDHHHHHHVVIIITWSSLLSRDHHHHHHVVIIIIT
jgi:hypothetical protein